MQMNDKIYPALIAASVILNLLIIIVFSDWNLKCNESKELSAMSSPEVDLFRRLESEDMPILQELNSVGDYQKSMEIYQKRISLYRRFIKETNNLFIQQILLSRLENIYLQAGIVETRHELQTDIAKLTSRIDDLESKRTSQ